MAKRKRPNNTGTLYHRKDGLWELRLTIGIDEETGKPKYKSLYAGTQAAVLRKGEEYKAEMKKGFPDGNTCTVEEWGAIYLEHHAKIAKLAQSTMDGYSYTMRLINQHLGKRQLKDLKAFEVERFLIDLRDVHGYSASMISKARGLLFQMCKAAVASDLMVKNVVAYIEDIRCDKAPPKESFAPDDVKKMMRNLPQDKIGWSIRVLLMTGLRKQELCALETKHIAEDGSTIIVEQAVTRSKGSAFISDTKTVSSLRVVHVPERARKYAILLRNCSSAGLIWESDRRHGQPINPKTFDDFYYAVLESVGVRRLSPHCCRHTYVSLMQAESVPMEVIRALVGHAKTNMTEHYLHIVETVKIEAVNKLNAYCE
jgi:integrase